MERIVLITTGGTIEKTYDEHTGELANRRSLVDRMLQELRLEGAEVEIVELMHKDSLHMDDEDRRRVLETVREAIERLGPRVVGGGLAGVVVLHGTDTLAETGRVLHDGLQPPRATVVLTGAMRPFEMKRSDALQNLTESLFASRTLPPGVYCVAHGRALPFPDVVKDRDRGTFAAGPA